MYIKHPLLLAIPIIYTIFFSWLIIGLGLVASLPLYIAGIVILIQFINDPNPPYEWPKQYFSITKHGIVSNLKQGTETRCDTFLWSNVSQYMPPGYIAAKISQKVVHQSSIWHVLGIMPTKDRDKILSAFKRMSMVYHPDVGGDGKAFNTLVTARDKALSKL